MEGSVDQSGHAELVRIVLELQSEVSVLREENQRLRDRVRDLERKNPTVRLDEPYSVEAEEKRREARTAAGNKGNKRKRRQTSERRGRRTTQEKIDQADSHQIAAPEGLAVSQCAFVRERPVWRIIDGRATLVVYEIWHGPNGEKPVIPGVRPRSEFGTEIQVTVAFLVSIVGLSMDKVCLQVKFFWNLDLAKSQADAILTQLSSRWEQEFETLCDLVACSAVVHADETSWSINSVWAFLSEQAPVLVFGCRKDADTLAEILPKDNFAGVLVSDDAAVYQGSSHAQKCWAHLLRKAIRLTLLYPDNDEYQSLSGWLDGSVSRSQTHRRG
jgi:transposase